MISSANDRVDREDIRQQSDETYQFWFYYDTSQCAAVHKSNFAALLLTGWFARRYDGKKTCDAPHGLGYSLLFFMPLLRVAGPEGRVGDICHFLRGLKCACCRRA